MKTIISKRDGKWGVLFHPRMLDFTGFSCAEDGIFRNEHPLYFFHRGLTEEQYNALQQKLQKHRIETTYYTMYFSYDQWDYNHWKLESDHDHFNRIQLVVKMKQKLLPIRFDIHQIKLDILNMNATLWDSYGVDFK